MFKSISYYIINTVYILHVSAFLVAIFREVHEMGWAYGAYG